MDQTTINLIGALATIMDAVSTSAPADFVEAACKDGARAIEAATGRPYSELPPEFFTWGPTR